MIRKIGGTYGSFLWELVSGDLTAHPLNPTGISVFGSQPVFGFGSGDTSFGEQAFRIVNISGTTSVSVRGSVSEPATLALPGFGLPGPAAISRGRRSLPRL